MHLFFKSTRVMTINVETVIGNALLNKLDEEAKFVSTVQFRLLKKSGSGKWCVAHDPSAKNETLINGRKLTETVELKDGDEIAVGNSTKGIRKMPLTVKLDADHATEIPAPDSSHSSEHSIGSDLVDGLGKVGTKIKDMAGNLIGSEGSPSPVRTIGSDLASGLGKVGGTIKDVAGGLMGTDGAPSTGRTIGRNVATGLGKVGGVLKTVAGGLIGALASGAAGTNVTLVRTGNSVFGDVILNIKDNMVRQGSSMFGNVVLTIDGEKIYRGSSSMFGDVLAHVDGDRVIQGNNMFGDVIAKIDGNKVVKGNGFFGDVIATVENGGRMSAAAAAVYLLLM
jgi:hypothetical protein